MSSQTCEYYEAKETVFELVNVKHPTRVRKDLATAAKGHPASVAMTWVKWPSHDAPVVQFAEHFGILVAQQNQYRMSRIDIKHSV